MTPSYKAAGDDDRLLRAARERAEAIQGLYIHLLVYVVINAGLFGINWLTRGDSGVWWFLPRSSRRNGRSGERSGWSPRGADSIDQPT